MEFSKKNGYKKFRKMIRTHVFNNIIQKLCCCLMDCDEAKKLLKAVMSESETAGGGCFSYIFTTGEFYKNLPELAKLCRFMMKEIEARRKIDYGS
jgi:hypothetical protein